MKYDGNYMSEKKMDYIRSKNIKKPKTLKIYAYGTCNR